MNEAYIPETRDELAQWLRMRREPVVIRGACPQRGAIAMSRLNRLVTYEPGEMIVQVGAGMSLKQLDDLLHEQQQWIPTLQPSEDDCTTVGGALSVGAYHPRDSTTIALRTTVLGGQFCTSDGEIFRSGSRVVKSVAGYDTHRAFVGARGTLGVILEVTLRVLPRPEKIVRFTSELEHAPLLRAHNPTAFERMNGLLLVELAGFVEDVDQSLEAIASRCVEVDDAQWSELVMQVRHHRTQGLIDDAASGLLSRLRIALDPKGVFVRD